MKSRSLPSFTDSSMEMEMEKSLHLLDRELGVAGCSQRNEEDSQIIYLLANIRVLLRSNLFLSIN